MQNVVYYGQILKGTICTFLTLGDRPRDCPQCVIVLDTFVSFSANAGVPRPAAGAADTPPRGRMRQEGVPARLKRLDKYLSQGLISQAERDAQRARILIEL